MNSIFVPKSIKNHSNILDEEIKAFYSLSPVNASNSDYDFNKQLDYIITEYLDTQSFKTANARRCFKKQLKKMILVDKPTNSKKYDHFLSWRLKQIAIHKSKQRDHIIDTISNQDLSEKYNELYKKYNKQTDEFYALMKENEELKEKLKKYESMSIIDPQHNQPKTEIIIEEKEEEKEKEEIIYHIEESSDEEEDDIYNIEPEKKEEDDIYNIEPEKKEEVKEPPKKVMKQYEKLDLVFQTKNITEEEYMSMENDEERLKAFWNKMDEAIEECEKFFIKSCKRDASHITEISNIFYDFHNEDFGNILEAIEGKVDTDKLDSRPFSILTDNLNQEAR